MKPFRSSRFLFCSLFRFQIFACLGLCFLLGKAHAETFASDGAWCWFQDPRALYVKGRFERTYASWMQSDGKLLVGWMDHSSHKVHSNVIKEKWDVDDHNTGSLLVLPDHRLMLFYARHNKQGLLARISSEPESIDTWGPEITVADTPRITYSHPVYLSDEKKFYVFWRGETWKPTFATSTDGIHWSKPRVLLQQQGREARDIRPYLKVGNDGNSIIHFAFTDGHPRNEPTNSVYYMQYSKGKLRRVDGSVIASMESIEAVSHLDFDLLYDARSTGARAWVWDVAQDTDGHPVVLYTRHPEETDHRYHWARWTGQKWQDVELCQAGKWFPETPQGVVEPEPHYSGGMSLNQGNPFQLCGARQVNGIFEIVSWNSFDEGKSWVERSITKNSHQLNVRPVIPVGAREGNAHVLFMSGAYRHYTDYHTSIQWRPLP